MTSPKLFGSDMHHGVRAVLLTAKALGVDLQVVDVNVYTKECSDDELYKVSSLNIHLELADVW